MVPELEYVVVWVVGLCWKDWIYPISDFSCCRGAGCGGGGRNPSSGKNDGLPVEEGPADRGGAETYICGHRFIGAHRETPRQGV